MIRPQLNSYVLIHVPPAKSGGRGGDIDGRVCEMVDDDPIILTRDRVCFFRHTGGWYLKDSDRDAYPLKGARLVHCHHQPPEADDSPEWLMVRHLIRRAMTWAKGRRERLPKGDDPCPPKEDA